MFDDIAQNRHVLLAIFRDAIFLARAPPFHSFEPVSALRSSQRVLGELIELHAMPQLLVQQFVNVHRPPAHTLDGCVGAQHLNIKPITVKRNHMRKLFQLRNQLQRILFIPSSERILLIPSDGYRQSKRADVPPSAIYFTRNPQRLNIQIDFAIE